MRSPLASLCLTACLALVALVNFDTTCCCGDSMLLEVLAGCCGTHGPEGHETQPGPAGPEHVCYKAGQSACVYQDDEDGDPAVGDAACGLVALASPAAPRLGDWQVETRAAQDGRVRTAGPLPVLHLLI